MIPKVHVTFDLNLRYMNIAQQQNPLFSMYLL